MAAVEVAGLRKRYAGVTALDEVTFSAAAGEVTAVLGPNGAGKTTGIEICCGLRRPDGGTARVLGLDPHRDRRRLVSRVGVMPQAGGSSASGVYPAMRVTEVLALYAAFYARPLPVADLLARLDLTRVAGTAWRRLSGGEQQRLSLGLAVIGRPEVVFLDEPSAGLDVTARHAMWQLIDDLRAAGVAIVLTTHAMDEAEHLADHIVVIDAGRVVGSGTARSLTSQAAAGVTFSAVPGLPTAEFSGGLLVEDRPGHYSVRGQVTPDLVAAVTAWCAARGVMPDQLSTGARLEDVFVELTERPTRP